MKTLAELKKEPKEVLMELGLSEGECEAFYKSKEGYIEIYKISPEKGDIKWGDTVSFGEGISCYIASIREWYVTSTITKIDWETHEFTTLNSVYKFKFKEHDKSKNKETNFGSKDS